MKTTSADMRTHLDQAVTALATCWIIDREDGVTKRFTDHDRDIEVGGDTYLSIGSYKRTASEATDTLSVDNLDIEGVTNELALPRDDLVLGTYDNATIRVFVTSWDGTDTGTLKLRRGFFGRVQTLPNGTFSVELRGVLQHLAHTYTKLYTATCLYDLGEPGCGVPINPDIVQRSTAYAVDDHVSADPDFFGTPFKIGDVFKLDIITPSFEGLSGNISNALGWYGSAGVALALGVPSPEGAKDGVEALKGGTTDGTISQDVDLLAAGVTDTDIDAGNIYLSLFGWRIGDNADTGQFVVQGLNNKLQVINTLYDSGAETLDVTDGWVRRGAYDIPIPIPQQINPTFGTDISFTAPDTITYTVLSGTDISFTAPDLMDSGSSAFGDLREGSVVIITGTASNNGTFTITTASTSQIEFVEQTIVTEAAGATVTVTRDAPFGSLSVGDFVEVSGSASNDNTYEINTISSTQITTVEQTIVTEAAGADILLTEIKRTRFIRISYSVVGTNADQYLDNVYGWLIDISGSGRLTYTEGDVVFRVITAGTTAASAPVQGYSYTLCDTFSDGSVTFFTDPAWTRAGEVTSSTGNRIFDITVLEGRGFTGWYDGGLITWETGKNKGASMEVKSWVSPGPVINPVTREKLTSGSDEAQFTSRGDFMFVDYNRGTVGTVYTFNEATTNPSIRMTVWDLGSLTIIEEFDLTGLGVDGLGYVFFGIDPDTGHLVGAEQQSGPDKYYQYVFDPVNKIEVTFIEVFASPAERLHLFDVVYAFLKHPVSGAVAVLNNDTTNVRAHTFPGLVVKNEFTRPGGWETGFPCEGKPGEAYSFWRNANVCHVQKYVIQTDGTVTQTEVGSIQAWQVGPGTFKYLSNRIRATYDADNDSIHFHFKMTGDPAGSGRTVGWSEANGLLYSTLVLINPDPFGTSASMHRIGNNRYCWDAETLDRVNCVNTITGELEIKSVPDISIFNGVLWDGVNQALYNFNSAVTINDTIETRKILVEGTRLGTIELYLSMPFPVESGDLFSIYPGCDKTNISCAVIFDNIKNFFGAPDVPGQDAILAYPDAK